MKLKIEGRVFLFGVIAVLAFASVSFADGGAHAETYQSLFVPAEWLRANLGRVTLIDARAKTLYTSRQGHIPGAVSAEWNYFADMSGKPGEPGYGAIFDPSVMARKMGALGIDGGKEVVVYGDGGDWGSAGWIVWLLRMMGFTGARILDGGFTVYRASGGRTSLQPVTAEPVIFPYFLYDESYIVTTDWVRRNAGNPDISIVDVRNEDEYTGRIKLFGESRPGHIPSAVNFPMANVLTDDFKTLHGAQLESVLTDAGFTDKERLIVLYDTSGVRGAFMTMVFRMAGYRNARNYNPGYHAWSGDPYTEVRQGPNP